MDKGIPSFYIDMDGVLAKWCETASQEEVASPGYFEKREPEWGVIGAAELLKKRGYMVRTISAYYPDGGALAEKGVWLDSYAPFIKKADRTFVPYGEDKSKYVDEDGEAVKILVDDYGKNLKEWAAAGNVPVKFMNGINNRPKLDIEDGTIKVHEDTWSGYTIDRRMTPEMMADILDAIGRIECERRERRKRNAELE